MAKPFIAAYKAGKTTPTITTDQLIYWYRPTPKGVNCDSTDNAGSKPAGADLVKDNIYVVSLLTAAGRVTVNSGGTVYVFDAPAGASAIAVPFKIGTQSFSMSRGGAVKLNATSLKKIVNECVCGMYNYNAYVGTVPAPTSVKALDSDGLSLFTKVQNRCQPTPSLPASPPATAAPTATSTVFAVPTNTPA